MPRSKQTATALATNVIKINIATKPKKKKPRKTRTRKPAPIAPPKVQPAPILMRTGPLNDTRNTNDTLFRNQNILRDLQTSQSNLSLLTKRNADDIQRLMTLGTSMLMTAPMRAPTASPADEIAGRAGVYADEKSAKPSKRGRNPMTPSKPPKFGTPQVNSEVKRLRDRVAKLRSGETLFNELSSRIQTEGKPLFDELTSSTGLGQSGAVPAPRNPAFGVAGSGGNASYQSFLDTSQRDDKIRREYYETIDNFNSIKDLKGWANRTLGSNQNASKKTLEELKEHLKADRFYDAFYAREVAQYPTPQKPGVTADDLFEGASLDDDDSS